MYCCPVVAIDALGRVVEECKSSNPEIYCTSELVIQIVESQLLERYRFSLSSALLTV